MVKASEGRWRASGMNNSYTEYFICNNEHLFMVSALNFYSLLKAIKSFHLQGKSFHSCFIEKDSQVC